MPGQCSLNLKLISQTSVSEIVIVMFLMKKNYLSYNKVHVATSLQCSSFCIVITFRSVLASFFLSLGVIQISKMADVLQS